MTVSLRHRQLEDWYEDSKTQRDPSTWHGVIPMCQLVTRQHLESLPVFVKSSLSARCCWALGEAQSKPTTF